MKIPKLDCLPRLFFIALFGLITVNVRAESNRSSLVISEIVFYPATPYDPAQIELLNIAEKSIDASGSCLVDQDGNTYVLPSLPLMPPGAFIVIQFGSSADKQAPEVLSFTTNVAWLQSRAEWAAKAFRGNENECALYSRSGQKAEDLLDFIRWGRRPRSNPAKVSDAQAQAIERKLWTAGDAVYVANPAPGDLPPIQPGGSIVMRQFKGKRFVSFDWIINTPRNVSIGSLNLCPIPGMEYPEPNLRLSLEGKMRFRWRGASDEKASFRLQVARDNVFNNIVVEQNTKEMSIEMDMEPGVYYWRVRQESDKQAGDWPSPSVFEIRDNSDAVHIPKDSGLAPNDLTAIVENLTKGQPIVAETSGLFKYLKWKPGVGLYEINGRFPFRHIAVLGNVKCPLSKENIGNFLEQIDTSQKAMELALYFHEGLLFIEKADILAFTEAAKKASTTSKEFGSVFSVHASWDSNKGDYEVCLILYESMSLILVDNLISPRGQIETTLRTLVEGPPVENGWNGPSPEFLAYAARVESFDQAVSSVLQRVAMELINKRDIDEQGMFKARQNAFQWLLDDPSMSAQSQQVINFLRQDGRRIPVQLRTHALLRLKGIGHPFTQTD